MGFVTTFSEKLGLAIGVGWGYDDDIPLRPWPQFWNDPVRYGGRYRGMAICGFFVGYTTLS